MKPFFILAIVLVAAAFAPAAAGQDITNASDIEFVPGQDATGCTEQIDDRTAICSVDYADGHVVIDLYSDRTQIVTLTDAGGIMQGGEINRETRPLRAEGITTVRFRATSHDGFVGVSIDTGRVLYGVPVETRSAMFGGPWTSSDAQAAALGAGVSVSFAVLLLVFRASRGKSQEPERVA